MKKALTIRERTAEVMELALGLMSIAQNDGAHMAREEQVLALDIAAKCLKVQGRLEYVSYDSEALEAPRSALEIRFLGEEPAAGEEHLEAEARSSQGAPESSAPPDREDLGVCS